MKTRKAFVAPQLTEEAGLSKLTLGVTVVSGRTAGN